MLREVGALVFIRSFENHLLNSRCMLIIIALG